MKNGWPCLSIDSIRVQTFSGIAPERLHGGDFYAVA